MHSGIRLPLKVIYDNIVKWSYFERDLDIPFQSRYAYLRIGIIINNIVM